VVKPIKEMSTLSKLWTPHTYYHILIGRDTDETWLTQLDCKFSALLLWGFNSLSLHQTLIIKEISKMSFGFDILFYPNSLSLGFDLMVEEDKTVILDINILCWTFSFQVGS